MIRGLIKRCKLANGKPNAYGNGLELSTEEDKNTFSYHGGGFEGFETWLARVPAEKISLIYLSNNPSLMHRSGNDELCAVAGIEAVGLKADTRRWGRRLGTWWFSTTNRDKTCTAATALALVAQIIK